MNLKQLTLVERMTLIGGRSLEATLIFHEKRAEDMTVDDLRTLREKMTRIIDLIEESEGHLQ